MERMDPKSEGPAIGIDLGTSNSCVGVWLNNRVEIISDDQGKRLTPSCVAFTSTERFIGDPAKNRATMNPTNTVFGNYSDLLISFLYPRVSVVFALHFVRWCDN
ncbi:hypothetical protein L6164_006637 [Bauhinia variegata]|uniref:Uncharacterized protein n=1 Tax=Bauhinia variegata TaxID=167791 RepID=A0ACB9PU99_BAUVA|nr:hypothetical protein L6164_006637 [Bauhinia variegata]